MQFLADVELICEECRGTRYKSAVLEVHYHGKSVHDVLQMTVREALAFFVNVRKSPRKLKVLNEIGLGYLRLGQSGTTLSGGEAQRLKLASHLTRTENAGILYISTSHYRSSLRRHRQTSRRVSKLLESGASSSLSSHNLDVIKSADWLIDLGPEGGDQGGKNRRHRHARTGRAQLPIPHRPLPCQTPRRKRQGKASAKRRIQRCRVFR